MSDAMTDEVITELAALAPDALAVIARTTAMRYDVQPGDVSSVPGPVAQAIAGALDISVGSGEGTGGRTHAAKRSAHDPIAYNEYVQGCYCFDHLIQFFDGFKKGMAHLEKAAARDCDRLIEQARLLIELEPSGPLGHWQLMAGLRGQGRLDEAVAAQRKAVELSGGAPTRASTPCSAR